jgi:hypothetical protein
LPCTVELDPDWGHGGFLFLPDTHDLWQRICDWVAPHRNVFRKVKSDPSFRGHIFALDT